MKKTAEEKQREIKRLLLIDGIIYEVVKLDKDKEDCRLNCDWYHDAICTGLNCPIAQVSEEFDSHLKLYKSQSIPPVSEEEIKAEWLKYRKMHFEWEYVEMSGCINESDFKEIIRNLLSRLPQRERHIPSDQEMRQMAEEYAKEHSNAPDKECPEWIIADFMAGAGQMRELLTGVIIKNVEQPEEKKEEKDDGCWNCGIKGQREWCTHKEGYTCREWQPEWLNK